MLFFCLLCDDSLSIHENLGAVIELLVSALAGAALAAVIAWAYLRATAGFRRATHHLLVLVKCGSRTNFSGVDFMRYLSIFLGMIMLAFAAVQYNDPDGLMWALIYAIPALWALLSAFNLPAVQSRTGTTLLWLTIAVALAGVVYYWPQAQNFWQKDVWYNDEAAREGMGVMILLVVLLAVRVIASRRLPHRA